MPAWDMFTPNRDEDDFAKFQRDLSNGIRHELSRHPEIKNAISQLNDEIDSMSSYQSPNTIRIGDYEVSVPLVVGLAVGCGAVVLLLVLCCCCCRSRSRGRVLLAPAAATPLAPGPAPAPLTFLHVQHHPLGYDAPPAAHAPAPAAYHHEQHNPLSYSEYPPTYDSDRLLAGSGNSKPLC